jgi:hypothetical protein
MMGWAEFGHIATRHRPIMTNGADRIPPRKPRTKSTPAGGGRWRRVWKEKHEDLPLSSEDLATKQSRVAKRNGLRPPTLARRWIDSTGGPGCRKWPYRCVHRIDREIELITIQIEEHCVHNAGIVPFKLLARLQALLGERERLVRPVVIKI